MSLSTNIERRNSAFVSKGDHHAAVLDSVQFSTGPISAAAAEPRTCTVHINKAYPPDVLEKKTGNLNSNCPQTFSQKDLYSQMSCKSFFETPSDTNFNAMVMKQELGFHVPKLFQPLQIRNLLLPNRIVVSPMGMYSSNDGHLNSFHMMHHGTFVFRGAGLSMVEVSAVLPQGRSSPLDAGIWSDAHIESFKRVVDFVHGLEGGGKIGIQLGHAGRKASMMPIYPHMNTRIAEDEDGGWKDNVCGA